MAGRYAVLHPPQQKEKTLTPWWYLADLCEKFCRICHSYIRVNQDDSEEISLPLFFHVFPGKGADTRCCHLWVQDLLWFCGIIHPYPHHDSNQFPWQRVQKGKWKLRTGGKSLKNPTPNSQQRKAPPGNHHISCSRCTSECHQASSTQPVHFFATPGTLDLSGLRNPRGFHWWVLWVVERPLSAVL